MSHNAVAVQLLYIYIYILCDIETLLKYIYQIQSGNQVATNFLKSSAPSTVSDSSTALVWPVMKSRLDEIEILDQTEKKKIAPE